jgi:hypothetical protein
VFGFGRGIQFSMIFMFVPKLYHLLEISCGTQAQESPIQFHRIWVAVLYRNIFNKNIKKAETSPTYSDKYLKILNEPVATEDDLNSYINEQLAPKNAVDDEFDLSSLF